MLRGLLGADHRCEHHSLEPALLRDKNCSARAAAGSCLAGLDVTLQNIANVFQKKSQFLLSQDKQFHIEMRFFAQSFTKKTNDSCGYALMTSKWWVAKKVWLRCGQDCERRSNLKIQTHHSIKYTWDEFKDQPHSRRRNDQDKHRNFSKSNRTSNVERSSNALPNHNIQKVSPWVSSQTGGEALHCRPSFEEQ